MAMNQEIKEKWVAALRSGDYKQGKGELHNVTKGTHCCLGVLCEIAVQAGVAEVDRIVDGAASFTSGSLYGRDAVLPDGVKDWAGMSSPNPIIPGRDLTLAGFNDRGTPFTEIADLIEQHL